MSDLGKLLKFIETGTDRVFSLTNNGMYSENEGNIESGYDVLVGKYP